MTEQIGRVVGGRYRLLTPLGSGASAEVYLADDVRLRRRVAVKLLHAGLSDDEAFLRRFRAEARAAAALSHPNIVAIFDWNGDEVPPYLVTEYLGGGSLRSMLDGGQRLSPSQALLVGLQAAQALDHAHGHGFVHRDIKPANLLFGTDARLRIADFGLARAIAEAAWTEPTGAMLGTARYASPEQVRGEPLDGRSDVYALTLVLIEAITGSVPFSADTTIGTLMARLDKPIPIPDDLGVLAPVLERAGQPVPSERPSTTALVNDLMDVATELPRPAPLSLAGATRSPGRGQTDPQDRTLLGVHAMPPGNGTPPQSQPPPGASVVPGNATIVAAPVAPGVPGVPGAPGGPQASRPSDRTVVHPPAGLRPPAAPSGDGPSGGFALSPNGGRNERPWLFRGAAGALALVLVVAGTWVYLQTRVPSHVVPQELIGAQQADVNRLVGEFGWHIKERSVFRDGTQAGTVLATDPEPGSKLREDGTLELTISLGPPTVPVPDLEGLTQEQADGVLRAAGVELVPEFVPTPDNDLDEGMVIGVEEGTPDHLPKDSTVRVLVSSGDDRGRVPDVEGWDADDAEEELERRGYDVQRLEAASDEVSEGKVIRTEPRANSRHDEGTVLLVVSVGDGPVRVPDVFNLTLDDARAVIEAAGLEVGNADGDGDDRVWSQDPWAGTEVDSGTEVDIRTW